MSLQGILTSLALPPLLLVVLLLAPGLWLTRRHPLAAAAIVLPAVGLLLLAMPMVEGMLRASLERDAAWAPPAEPPGAIIVLGGEIVRGADGAEIGPLTLERLRAAAALHRRTKLPLLVTGGILAPGSPPVAVLMARSLEADFNVPVRWVEDWAADTRGNAMLSAALLRKDGVGAAYLVSHAWHLPRAHHAFIRAGFVVHAAPVRISRAGSAQVADWIPRPDHIADSWYMIREWVGRAVYALRDDGTR